MARSARERQFGRHVELLPLDRPSTVIGRTWFLGSHRYPVRVMTTGLALERL